MEGWRGRGGSGAGRGVKGQKDGERETGGENVRQKRRRKEEGKEKKKGGRAELGEVAK